MPKMIDLIGRKFGRLTVLVRAEKGKSSGKCYWLCKCDCGVEKIVIAQALLHNLTKSCGCLCAEKVKLRATTHGATVKNNGKKTPEYSAWSNMNARCYRTTIPNFKDYGGRGITVCDRWRHSFENFFADMGLRPSPEHSLDRYPDNDGNYEPHNCRWATVPEQNRNKTQNVWIEYKGERKVVTDWAKHFGVHKNTFLNYLKKMSFEDAVSKVSTLVNPKNAKGSKNPHAKKVALYINGVLVKEYGSIKQVEEDGYSVKRIYGRLHKFGGKDKGGVEWIYIDKKAA